MNNMKKILSLLLISTIMTLQILPVYAENNVNAIELDLKGKSKQNGVCLNKEKSKIESKSKTAQQMELGLEKENIPLKSSLQKDYTLTYYRIKNNSPEPIEILISNNLDPNKTLRYLDSKKKRFPIVYLLIPSAFVSAKNDLADAFVVNNGMLFFAGIFSSVYNVCVKFPLAIGQSIWYTVAAPHYATKDKQDNKLIQQDFAVFENQKFQNSMPPNGEMKFYVLVFKEQNGLGRTLFITVRHQDGTKYTFRY